MKYLSIGFSFWSLMAAGMAWMILSCVTPQSSLADKTNYTRDDNAYKRSFTVSFDEQEKPLRYWYHYIVSSFPEGYTVRIFHPDKKVLTEERTYSTSSLTLLHGAYKSFWDDGSIRAQGIYQFGRKHGNWLECEPGIGKSSSGEYLNHKKEGLWTQLDTNGLIESVYTWHNGKLHGKFYEYDGEGEKINEGIYKDDQLVSALFKKPAVQKPYLRSCQGTDESALYLCSESKLVQQVNSTLKYPSRAKEMGIEGSVLVQWDVMPDGRVQNLRIPQALSDEIELECRRVLQQMGEWVPAKRGGEPIRWTMSLPIQFSL